MYTDLDARYSVSYTEVDNKEAGAKTSTLGSELNFTGRLIPGLVGLLSGRYSKGSGQAATYGGDLDINWRISEIMSLTSGYNQIWSSHGNFSSMDFSMNFAVTHNMQLSVTHKYLIQPVSNSDTSLDWRWTINNYVSLMTSGTYSLKEVGDYDWSVASRLSASFSSM